jgi:hypothetical protein
MKNLNQITAATLLLGTSLFANAGIGDLGLVNPCESSFLGLIEISNSTRISSVEKLVDEQIAEVKKLQRFTKYDVKEVANKIQSQFEAEAAALNAKLQALRVEYATKNFITLDNGKQLDGFAATEYLKIIMSRYIAQVSGSDYLTGIYSELDDVAKEFGQVLGRLTVIDALIDSSSSDEVLSSACVALKEVDKLQIDFPYKGAESLRRHALKQSKPVTESELSQFLADGQLPKDESMLGQEKMNSLVRWAKSLIN